MAHNRGRVEAIIVTGGAPLDDRAVAALPRDAFMVAADGGLDHALAAGLEPDVLVGDLDSISPGGLDWANANATVLRHPVDKAATDTELAIAHALTVRPARLILVAGAGDRLDHAVAALGALGAPELGEVRSVEAWWGTDRVLVAVPQRPVTLDAPAGTTFSVLAMHGPVAGVTISGASWPLDRVDLAPLVGWGVSNAVLEPPVHVAVDDGVLTVIVPNPSATGAQP